MIRLCWSSVSRAYTARFDHRGSREYSCCWPPMARQNTKIAQRLSVHVDVVSTWRKRFFESYDCPGRGRPRSFTPEAVAEAQGNGMPSCHRSVRVPLSQVGSAELAAQALANRALVGWPCRFDSCGAGYMEGRDQALAAPLVDLPATPVR